MVTHQPIAIMLCIIHSIVYMFNMRKKMYRQTEVSLDDYDGGFLD